MIDSRAQMTVMEPTAEPVEIEWHDHSLVGRPRVLRPALTVRNDGTIYLNPPTLDALGRPERLRIGYDAARRMIALRAARQDERGSFRGSARKQREGVGGIRMTAFFKRHNIMPPQTTRFQSTRSVDGVLLFPLDNGEVVERRQSHD